MKQLTVISNRISMPLLGIIILSWLSFPSAGRSAQPPNLSQVDISEISGELQAYEVQAQPLISISFDDASQTVYDSGLPILDSQGIPATFYFISSCLTNSWIQQLNHMQDLGWEIGSHSVTHQDMTTQSTAEIIYELTQSKSDLEAAGLTIDGFAYPYGAGHKNNIILRQVKEYYKYARSTTPGYNYPVITQYDLPVQVQTASTSIELMKSWVDSAIEHNEWLIIAMHTVDTSGDTYSIAPATLSELAVYIKNRVDAGKISTVTVREGIKRQTQTFWQPIQITPYSIENNLVLINDRALWLIGQNVNDYIFDGYEWVKNGQLYYQELNGSYHEAQIPTQATLISLSEDKAVAQFKLTDSTDGNFHVLTTITLSLGNPLTRIDVNEAEGTAKGISIQKQISRRFSTNGGDLVTDGSLETGIRTNVNDFRWISVFDTKTDVIRIMTQYKDMAYSEYSGFSYGVFSCKPIRVPDGLPFSWFVGGIPFETLDLFVEAETGSSDGSPNYYNGEDASPKTGHTGIILGEGNDSLTLNFSPPARGNYMLAIRQKGITNEDQYTYQIDGGKTFSQTVTGTYFGYENIPMTDLTDQTHTLVLSNSNGTVFVDYILLIPISRTADTPKEIVFPFDIVHQTFKHQFLPYIVQDRIH
jgi:peptidoglycan/xylan/chitin deacetylase (PgdA/CDA1 family)